VENFNTLAEIRKIVDAKIRALGSNSRASFRWWDERDMKSHSIISIEEVRQKYKVKVTVGRRRANRIFVVSVEGVSIAQGGYTSSGPQHGILWLNYLGSREVIQGCRPKLQGGAVCLWMIVGVE